VNKDGLNDRGGEPNCWKGKKKGKSMEQGNREKVDSEGKNKSFRQGAEE